MLDIRREHLQFALKLLLWPQLDYPQPFLQPADIFFSFFKFLDHQATLHAVAQTKNTQIEPSYFGESVLRLAGQAAVKGALIGPILKDPEVESGAKEALKNFAAHAFMNLAGLYIGPMYAAIEGPCPYMPHSWIDRFVREKVIAVQAGQFQEDLDRIVHFLAQVQEKLWDTPSGQKSWVDPYHDLAGQLGYHGSWGLPLLIGMFLEANDRPNMPESFPASPSPFATFIQTLDLEDFGRGTRNS